MNDYRITYITKDNETYSEVYTARSEAAAKKGFTVQYRSLGYKITAIELIRENTCATKQQERDALETIKKMVAELGPQSYLATAFEGCFEDAEQNIENDWGCSQKQLADTAAERVTELEAEVKHLKEQLAESEKDYEAAHAAAHTIAEEKDAEIAALWQRILSADDLTDCRQMAQNLVDELRRKVKAAEATILEYAEHPESKTFCDAVKERKNLTADIAYYTALSERLEMANTNTADVAA